MLDRPLVAWWVIEADIDEGRDNTLFARLRGPFPDEEMAQREQEAQQDSWEEALEEWDGENPYDFKGWHITYTHIYPHEIDKLEKQDEESHRRLAEAADAVMEGLLDDH